MYVSLAFLVLVALAGLSDYVNGFARCPNGKRRVQCSAKPCAVNQCPAFPTANCRDDYCGGCNARFYMDNQEVTMFCTSQQPDPNSCPLGGCQNMVNCFVEPCRGKTCPGHPNARCCNNYCGGCNWGFSENYQEVTSTC